LCLILSPEIEVEYHHLASKPTVVELFKRHGVQVGEYLDLLADLCSEAVQVRPQGIPPHCRDEDDRKYLHCATTVGADYLVSLDKHLLEIGLVGATPILSPAAFLSATEESGVVLDR
jgi:predicted nucleic acid-binding protein